MHLVLQVLAAARAMEKSGQQVFRQHGLTVAQFNILNLLSDRPDGLRASGLAQALVVDPSNITGLLKRMHRAGFLAEKPNPADARQHVVILAAKGRRLWRKAEPEYRRRLQAIESGFSIKERRVASSVLDRLTREAS